MSQTYADFCRALGLPTHGGLATGDAADLFALHTLALALGAVERPPATSKPQEETDDDLEETMTLEPGGTREATKSPSHLRLKLDNWTPEADDAAVAAEGDVQTHARVASRGVEGDGSWVDVPCAGGGGVSGPRPLPADDLFAEDDLPLPEHALQGARTFIPTSIGLQFCSRSEYQSRMAAVCDSLPDEAPSRTQRAPLEIKRVGERAEVEAFQIDPDFDFDAAQMPRFFLARALAEGEFYDVVEGVRADVR